MVPSTHIINYKNQAIDVDREAYYIEVNCSSVDEARKRALVLAYLTYDVREHNFVQLNTGAMMENPHVMNKMYKILDTFGIDLIDKEQGLDLKSVVAIQRSQPHSGFLCTDKDQNEMRYHDRYKTMLFNDRLIHMSIRDDLEERLMDREQMQLASRMDVDNASGAGSKTQQGLTLWETRKINEQNLNEMKLRMHEHIRKKTQEFRELKHSVKLEVRKDVEALAEEKRQDVSKQREIKKIIKNEQKAELDRNIQVFLHLNREERALRTELCEKQMELQYKERFLKRVNVRHQAKVSSMKREEREKFIGTFAQAKNLIEKQMKLGNLIRD